MHSLGPVTGRREHERSVEPCGPSYKSLRVGPPKGSATVVISAWLPYFNGYLPACAGINVTFVIPRRPASRRFARQPSHHFLRLAQASTSLRTSGQEGRKPRRRSGYRQCGQGSRPRQLAGGRMVAGTAAPGRRRPGSLRLASSARGRGPAPGFAFRRRLRCGDGRGRGDDTLPVWRLPITEDHSVNVPAADACCFCGPAEPPALASRGQEEYLRGVVACDTRDDQTRPVG